tara:strand:+ start:780 stop:1022 length:243 start_codon:yes stop_codon:yes gene_type:complete
MAERTNGASNSSAIHFDKKVITYAVKNIIIFNDIILLFKHLPENTHQQNSQNFYAARCVEIRQQPKSKSTTNNNKRKEEV